MSTNPTPSLFQLEPVSIASYTPKLSLKECLLNYSVETKTRTYGLGYASDASDSGTLDTYQQHSLTIPTTPPTTLYISLDLSPPNNATPFFSIARLCNHFLQSTPSTHEKNAHEWLRTNAVPLSTSMRYWEAQMRLQDIENLKEKITTLQQQLELAIIHSNVDAIQVLQEKPLTPIERQQLLLDYGFPSELLSPL